MSSALSHCSITFLSMLTKTELLNLISKFSCSRKFISRCLQTIQINVKDGPRIIILRVAATNGPPFKLRKLGPDWTNYCIGQFRPRTQLFSGSKTKPNPFYSSSNSPILKVVPIVSFCHGSQMNGIQREIKQN